MFYYFIRTIYEFNINCILKSYYKKLACWAINDSMTFYTCINKAVHNVSTFKEKKLDQHLILKQNVHGKKSEQKSDEQPFSTAAKK